MCHHQIRIPEKSRSQIISVTCELSTGDHLNLPMAKARGFRQLSVIRISSSRGLRKSRSQVISVTCELSTGDHVKPYRRA